MRKKSGFFYFAVFLLAGVIARAAVVRPEISVPYIDPSRNTITIDGSDGDWPDAILENKIHFFPGDGNPGNSRVLGTTVLGTMSGREDGDVTICLAHDGEHLFILASIQDDLLEQRVKENNRNEAWKEDALHIYIDSNNAEKSDIPGSPIVTQPGYEQFGVSTDYNCYTENVDFTTSQSSGTAGMGAQPDQVNWLAAIQISGSGPFTYVFEERVPLREVTGHNLRTMNPGESYGFNAEFVDSDAGVYLQGWIFWSGNGNKDVWNCENLWGKMVLKSIPISNIRDWMLNK